MCSGYRGVMLLAPFDSRRYAFPWQPVWNIPAWAAQMFPSLLGSGGHHSWVFRAALDEIVVVWAPMIILVVLSRRARKRKKELVPVKVTE